MTDIKEYKSTLTMPEKVELFNDLYSELAGYGTEGDTELAHVNTFEARLLKSIGGSGTINEITGLRQFGGGGGQPAPAPQQQVKQEASFPAELRPFVKDVLTQGQAEFEREQEEGFQPFPGPQIAEFGPEQLAAQELGRRQFTGLAGTALADPRTYYQPALSATALGTAEIGTEDIQRRMDPFLQNVVDIAKREAIRDEEAAVQGRAAQAVGAGSFGGTRQALVESEAERNLAERLGDIQARGLSSAFQNAQLAAEQQRQREMTGGRQFAALGDITGTRARSDLSGLAGIGEIQQQREQQALDLARREFLEEQAFPQRSLQRYASLIRGFPLDASQQRTTTDTLATPSLAQTLVGGLGTAAGLYGAFGGFKKEGGLVGLQGGGQPMMDQQQPNELDTIEMLRQRGAAIRGLSEPVGGGGVVNRFMGSKVSAAIQKAQGGEGFGARPTNDGIMNLILQRNPKFLRKLKALGMGTSGGAGKTGYAEFNPGTAGSQYAEGGIVSLATSGAPNWYTGGGRGSMRQGQLNQQAAALEKELDRLEAMKAGAAFAYDNPTFSRGDLSKRQELADRIREQSERYEQRQAQLDERRQQAQWGNVAKFFGRLGTDVSPAAQQGGLRGLLGATVSAGQPSVDEVLATEEEYYGKDMDLGDQIAAAEIAGLEAEAGIEETQYSRDQDAANYEITKQEADAQEAYYRAQGLPDALKIGVFTEGRKALAAMMFGAHVVTDANGDPLSIDGEAIDKGALADFNEAYKAYMKGAIESKLEGAEAHAAGIEAVPAQYLPVPKP